MRVVIVGGGGFVGLQLCRALLRAGQLRDSAGTCRPITAVVLHDVAQPATVPSDPRVSVLVGDITRAEDCAAAVRGADCVVHLAGVMSGTGEKDYDLCMRVNLDGTRNLVNACRALPAPPKFFFASSNAVFGEADTVAPTDSTKIVPRNTYGVTKACGELIVSDATRRGFVDGRVGRLPTVIVRPGQPNAATTGCFSGVIREPLAGLPCCIPLDTDLPHAVTSTRCVVANLVSLIDLPAAAFAGRLERAVNLPARQVTLDQLVATLKALVHPEDQGKLGRITREPDPFLSRTVRGMCAQDFVSERALALGLQRVPPLETIVREYVEDFGNETTCVVRLRAAARM